ncbi:hypothetical protein BKA56DRAFT_651518 [Ilyonectria sp. MPI-CAGE-AT-0026]|nr:hypothetical protein BKA56DRAFT_651518 [Ilyonectria sp. MPI-CAGE-AT-0026]
MKGDETYYARIRQDWYDHFQEDERTEEFAHYPGYSDAEPFAAPQKPKVKSSVPGSVEARRKGASRVAAPPHADRASSNYHNSAKSSAGSSHPGKRHRCPSQELEYSDELAEDMQDSFSEEEQLEEQGHGHGTSPAQGEVDRRSLGRSRIGTSGAKVDRSRLKEEPSIQLVQTFPTLLATVAIAQLWGLLERRHCRRGKCG